MRKLVTIVGGLLLGLASDRVLAEDKLIGGISLFYFDEDATRNALINGTNRSVKTTTNYTFFGLGLCYAMDAFCLGLKYIQDDITTKVRSSVAESEELTRLKGLGLSLGYSGENLIAQAVYIIDGTKTLSEQDLQPFGGSGTGSVVYPAKSAYVIDIGYGFKLASMRIGPLLSISKFAYSKVKAAGTTTDLPTQEKDDFIVPHLALWVDF
jgi:hypothetical protein